MTDDPKRPCCYLFGQIGRHSPFCGYTRPPARMLGQPEAQPDAGSARGSRPPEAHGIRLVQTCGACPEQYDAYAGDNRVGYLRLRHGQFTVRFPDASGELVYSAETIGDGLFDESERDGYLNVAKMAIAHKLNTGQRYCGTCEATVSPRPQRTEDGTATLVCPDCECAVGSTNDWALTNATGTHWVAASPAVVPVVPMSKAVVDENTPTDEQRAHLLAAYNRAMGQPTTTLVPEGMETHHDPPKLLNAKGSMLLQAVQPGMIVTIVVDGHPTNHVVKAVDHQAGTITFDTHPDHHLCGGSWINVFPVDDIHDHTTTED